MPILMPFLKLAYYPIPKIACTSMKHAIFRINNEIDYKDINRANRRESGELSKRNRCQIHAIYKTEDFSLEAYEALSDYRKIALVRDPMERIVSAYSNRLLSKLVLEKPRIAQQLANLGLPIRPTLDEFVHNIADYRRVSQPIRTHIRPIQRILGDDVGRFDLIFHLKNMADLEAFLSNEIGHPIMVPREQASAIKLTLDDLSDSSFSLLQDFCRGDYALLKDLCPMPQRLPQGQVQSTEAARDT